MTDLNTKNAKFIEIPYGTTNIGDEEFIDFINLEEIVIPNTVEYIGKGAFKGCKSLKKVILSANLSILDDYAFSECESLEEITIPESLHYFAEGVFSHCYNLKKINFHDNIDFINDYAFYKCSKLEKFDIPKNVTSVGKLSFYGCSSIKEIYIPENIELIEYGAFSYMSSLKIINVSKDNKKYLSIDDDTILVSRDGLLLQYAINSDNDEIVIGYYEDSLGEINNEFGLSVDLKANELVYNIADFAFAGAKKLRKIYFPSEMEGFGGKTFLDCDNLKDLEIFHSNFGNVFLLHIFKLPNEEASIPFENIIIEDGIKAISNKLSDLFKNAHSVQLPDSIENIGEDVFLNSDMLKELIIPNGIKSISPNTFHPNINLIFKNFGCYIASNFNMLQTKTSEDFYLKYNNRGNITIFSLTDGTYYVKIDDFDVIKVNRDEIASLSKNSNIMIDKPEEFVQYLFNLISINVDKNIQLTNIWLNPKLKEIFDKFVTDIEYVEEIATKKVYRAIREILDNSGIYDEFLFNGLLIRKNSKEEILKIVDNYSLSLNRFFKFMQNSDDDNFSFDVDILVYYCNLLERYHVYDRFLYNQIFVNKLNKINQELLIKYFNKNIKRLLLCSNTLNDSYGENLNDLLNLCRALGIFNDDEILSQKITTFIVEKIFDENSTNRIVGNDIHTIFGEINPRSEIDYEFINFFVDNYDELISLDKKKTGIISRIYNSFRNISMTSTSHKGSQRHLKVTINKCLNYFLLQRFEGVTDENKELAIFLQKYYSEPYALNVAEMIYKQAVYAPRNIFSKVLYDNNNNPIYSYDENEDLFDSNPNGYSYQWLPKQDFDNLILGKYCSCCAHILGAGAGIMRASMILDNCQNLVIKNADGVIVAKMTIYVNKKDGYAVFNTAEVNLSCRHINDLKEIADAFLRGSNAFVERYNQNNDISIKIVTIGEYRNSIKDILGKIETQLYSTPNFSSFAYYADDKLVGNYDGDCKGKQLLVLKK